MPDASLILRYPGFWQHYCRASTGPLDKEILRHFGTRTIDGSTYAEAVFMLPCGTNFSLKITFVPDLAGSITLGLQNEKTQAVSEMGWWDDAGWHPHALRWSELEQLHRYWQDHPIAGIHPSAAFLLLALFVGNGADERNAFSHRKDSIAKHYEHLKLFAGAEIKKLVKHTFMRPFENDYRWNRDMELGWVFGGEYPCYSLRNREHASGSEGRFPFMEWAAVMNWLEQRGRK